ncbi:MAG TPA: tetratricopeptide repeat protein [Dehalococcoidia bacterium]|nr:tetratricopeptide repeat protein [Dehalococcoidia bacterium]
MAYPSKVALPSRRAAVIHRERLTELLAGGLERRVTLVSAPAGYGKTTLLLDFAQGWTTPVCWYGLDERDRNPETFLCYFLACGRRQFPGFGAELAAALLEGRPLTPDETVDLMAAAVASVGERFLLILDDFHYLDEAAPELQRVLEGWVYRLPENCQLVLSGRTWPQLGVLPLMSARQEVATIGGADFAFTCDEVVQLFREVLGKEISLDDAQHLADITEGWAAALVLMADKVQIARTSISLEQLRPADTLFRYVKLEQFDPLPAEVKEFLLASAVPRFIEVDLVQQLTGGTDAEQKLEFLQRRNLFVLPEGGQGRYRYQRLFRAFLVSHFRTNNAERFRALNLRAAALQEEAGRWEEAVYHYVQAAAWDEIVQVTERVGRQLFEEGKWDTLADWLEAIPADELAAQPKLVFWKARVLYYLNQPDRALALLAGVIQSAEASSSGLALAEALITKGMCLRVKGDYQSSRQALSRARSLVLEHDGPASLLAEARKELGITLGMFGEFAQALEELKAVLDVYEALGDAYNTAHVHNQIGNALMALGRLSEAAVALDWARQRWLKLGNELQLLQTLNNLGLTYYLEGDYDRAEQVWRQAMDKTSLEASRKHESYLLVGLGDIRRDKGQYREALDMYQAALEASSMLDEAYIRIYIMDAVANSHRLMGDIGAAESWSKRAAAEAAERAGGFEGGLCALTRGLLLRDRGQLKEAAASLEESAKLLKKGGAKRELAAAYFHLAGVYFSLKRKRQALELLEMTAALVSDLGYDHFLRVEAARMPLLVQYAAANKLANGYFAQLLKVVKGPAPAPLKAAEGAAETEAGPSTAYAFGFGNLRVEMAGREITDLEWRSEKSKEMFVFFLCNRRPLRKDEIVTALWPDLPEDKTSSAFHSTLYRLRQALYPECIAKDSGRYILDPRGRFVFDVEEFQRALQEAAALPQGSPEALAGLARALELYKGSFAADFYTEWAESLRWQLEEQYMRLLTTLSTAYARAGEYKRSAELCQRLLDVDELNEAAWYRLMSNYIQSGHLEAARYCYNRYAQIVSDNLSGEAPPDFEEVRRQIMSGDV